MAAEAPEPRAALVAPTVRVASVGVVVLVVLAIAWAGRVSEGTKALVECDAAIARGDTTEAILSARIAAEARCPGCTAPDEAIERLERIANDADARGDHVTAFAAWRGIRSALLATTTFATATERRARADSQIAHFAHRIEKAAAAAGGSSTPAAGEERLRAGLAEADVPKGTTFALVGLGGIVFLGAIVRFVVGSGGRGADLGFAAIGALVAGLGALFF